MTTANGSRATKTYRGIDEFYAERGGRLSGESDFGSHWTDGGIQRFRVSVVHETGDVYAHGGLVLLLGTVPTHDRGPLHYPDRGGACAIRCAYSEAETILRGWADPGEHTLMDAVRRLAVMTT